jgi:hypothetical protein
MATDNLKDFSMQWIMGGLLFFSLLTFTIYFMYNNSPNGLGDSSDKFNNYSLDMRSKLMLVEGDANNLLNISSQTNPEVSDQGSKDSVATSYGIMGSSKSFWDSSKTFIGWMFSGDSGKMLITLISGIFGLTSLYFITKWIRNGI